MNIEPDSNLERNTHAIIILLGILCVISIGFVLSQMSSVILPLAFAVFMGFILNPIIGIFEKRGVPGAISILLAVLLTFLIMVGLGILITGSIVSFREAFQPYQESINNMQQKAISWYHNLIPDAITPEGNTDFSKLLENFSATSIVTSVLGSVSGVLSNTFLVLMYLLFMLMGRNQLSEKLKNAFSSKTSGKMSGVLTNINEQIQKYLITKTLISLLTAFLTMIVLLIFGVEFVTIWSVLTFLLNFIPSVGSIIATLLPLTIAFIQFNWLKTLVIGLCLFAIQFTVGNILEPKIIGKSINLSPLVILFSLIFWGWLWGIIGMFLAVPITVMIKIVFENTEELKFVGVLMSSNK